MTIYHLLLVLLAGIDCFCLHILVVDRVSVIAAIYRYLLSLSNLLSLHLNPNCALQKKPINKKKQTNLVIVCKFAKLPKMELTTRLGQLMSFTAYLLPTRPHPLYTVHYTPSTLEAEPCFQGVRSRFHILDLH